MTSARALGLGSGDEKLASQGPGSEHSSSTCERKGVYTANIKK